MKPPKSKETMLAALAQHAPAQLIESEIVDEKPFLPSDKELVVQSEEDYEFTRATVRKLILTTDDAIAAMMNFAQDSEHPRAFEVLANLIKTQSDVNKQLMDIQKERKKLIKGEGRSKDVSSASIENQQNNNVIFAGTTEELQKFLNAHSDK